jgi:cytochrome c-type biogenesis protein CcmH/NrfG
MNLILGMWIVWGVLVLVYVAIRIYVARLDLDENDTILLDDAFAHERAAQEAIIAKVKKIEPARRVVLIALVVMSLIVIGYYVWNMWQQFQ